MPSTSGISDEINQHGDAGTGELRDKPMDLRLGTNVDAPRRLVEDQDFGLGNSQRPISTFC